jgi:peptidoglycan LD-endopeptidase CwlK
VANPPVPIPRNIYRTLALITVFYISYDGKVHQGQVVAHRELKNELEEIFRKLLLMRFPIEKVIPISEYGWDDNKSMADNNSSAFNYRFIERRPGELSQHAYAWALDLNPRENPFVDERGAFLPAGAVYDHTVPGTITPDGPVVRLFVERGWKWGGDWISVKDYQHFQKVLS